MANVQKNENYSWIIFPEPQTFDIHLCMVIVILYLKSKIKRLCYQKFF